MTCARRLQLGSCLLLAATLCPEWAAALVQGGDGVGAALRSPAVGEESELQMGRATDFVSASATFGNISWLTDEDNIQADCPASPTRHSMIGAYVFLLALLPTLFIAVDTCVLRRDVVVVAGRQELPPAPVLAAEDMEMMRRTVLVASIEHDIVHDLSTGRPRSKHTAGGLGKVAGQLQRIHPTDLISVHPVFGVTTRYGFERGHEGDPVAWEEVPDVLRLTVDGEAQEVRVYQRTVFPPEEHKDTMPTVTYLMLEHPKFRTREGLYKEQPGSADTLSFFSLWNQAVGALIAMTRPEVYQCPDYHTALAPWYALRASGRDNPPPRLAVILHNAEYQGAILSQHLLKWQLNRLARMFNLPASLMKKYMMAEGGFNMLQAAVSYSLLMQRGQGVCAVSDIYAEESKVKHRVLWPLPQLRGLPNPMLEVELPAESEHPLAELRRQAKEQLYAADAFKPQEQEDRTFGIGYLEKRSDARIFGFVGRWVKQKGLDYVAYIAESLLTKHPNLQLVIAGPVGDAYGLYTELKLTGLARKADFRGRLKVLPFFFNINDAVGPLVKYAFDFCLMPSRDEPFGYVDIEFGWFGALTVGSITGGLGKVPGIYYMPSNVSSSAHVCELLARAVARAMALSDRELLEMAQRATQYRFPVANWQHSLLQLYASTRNPVTTSYNTAELRDLFDSSRPLQVRLDLSQSHAGSRRALGDQGGDREPGTDTYVAVEEPHSSFIRREVGDGDIRDDVQRLVEEQDRHLVPACCSSAPTAQTILDITQWTAMRRGEYQEEGLGVRPPFFGLLRPLTREITSWLAGEWCGIKRIDFFILVEFFEAPFLQAFWTDQLQQREDVSSELLKMCGVVYTLTACIAMPLWTRLSMSFKPNVCMAATVALRIPFAFVDTVMGDLPHWFNIVLLYVLLGLLTGGDCLFVYYNFLGTSVGDISKLALRMGTCYGIYAAVSFLDDAVVAGINRTTVLRLSERSWEIYVWAVAFLKGLLAVLYVCAPAPYREFHLPEWDFRALTQHRSTLMYLRRGIIVSAITNQAVSGQAVLFWRTSFAPLRDSDFLGVPGLSPNVMYEFLPFFLALATVLWSFFIYRIPNKALSVIKCSAFLLAPAALFYSLMALYVGDDTSHLRTVDALLVLSAFLDAVRTTSIYMAILSVVGSRWRFISFMVSTSFFQGLVQTLAKLFLALLDVDQEQCASAFANTWMPVVACFALLEWAVAFLGFTWFDQESQMLLTKEKRSLLWENGWDRSLRELRRNLAPAHPAPPAGDAAPGSQLRVVQSEQEGREIEDEPDDGAK